MLAILNYHHVASPPAGAYLPELYVHPDDFARQMHWLRRLGLRGVSLSEGVRRLRAGRAAGCVALTFDDGYVDNVRHAAPVLAEYGFGATCFPVAGCLGGYNHWDTAWGWERESIMSHADVDRWLGYGLEVGSHTCTHPRLPTLSREQAMKELVYSREYLRGLTGRDVTTFCYPYGAHSAEVESWVAQAGYEIAVTVRRGRARPGDGPLNLPRIAINGRKGLLKFLLKASTPYVDARRLMGAA